MLSSVKFLIIPHLAQCSFCYCFHKLNDWRITSVIRAVFIKPLQLTNKVVDSRRVAEAFTCLEFLVPVHFTLGLFVQHISDSLVQLFVW